MQERIQTMLLTSSNLELRSATKVTTTISRIRCFFINSRTVFNKLTFIKINSVSKGVEHILGNSIHKSLENRMAI